MHHPTEQAGSPAVRRDRRNTRGVYGLALLASVLVHMVILLGVSFRLSIEPRQPSAPASRIVHVTPAMQVYEIVEVAYDVAPIEVRVVDRAPLRPQPVRRTPPASVSEPTTAGAHAPIAPVDPIPVRDRLRYRLNTPQVWQPPSEEIHIEPSPQERVELRIASRLGEFNDSVAAEAAAAERANDWTIKDENGGRWGVSPGAIHLGSITIPLGDSRFAAAPGRREEFEGRVRTWNELQDQAVREEAKGEFKDRVRAIEERMNKAREARRTGSSAPPRARPDTTRTGG